MADPWSGPRPFRPEKFRSSVALAEQCQGGIEAVPASRLRGLGRLAKRAIRRVLRFYLAPQIGFNTGVLESLRETERSLGELARRGERSAAGETQLRDTIDTLARRIEQIEGHLPRLAGDVDAELSGVRARIGEVEAAGSTDRERIESVERFLPELSKDLQRSLSEQQDALSGLLDRLESVEGFLPEVSQSLQQSLTEQQAALIEQRNALGNALDRFTGIEGFLPDFSHDLQQKLAGQEVSVAALLERIEKIETFLPRMTGDVETDLAALRSDSSSLGRQVDEVGGELVAASRDIDQLREDAISLEDELRQQLERVAESLGPVQKLLRAPVEIGHFDLAQRYRGDPNQLAKHLRRYARIFGPVERVLDFGCGRGEFLEVCREVGIGAYGVDSDPDMVSHCRLKRFEVHEQDALEHLRGVPDRSLDGLFSAQVIEHLGPWEIVELIALAKEKLKRGAKLVVETINPDTLVAMRWFYLDPTHRQPVPSEMLRYLLERADFEVQDIILSAPVPDDEKLSPLKPGADFEDPALQELVETLNRNERRLNEVIFGPQDYAIVAER